MHYTSSSLLSDKCVALENAKHIITAGDGKGFPRVCRQGKLRFEGKDIAFRGLLTSLLFT